MLNDLLFYVYSIQRDFEYFSVRGSGDDTSFYDCQVYSDLKDLPTEKFNYVYDYKDNLYYSKTWECEAPPCPPEEQVTVEGESCPVCPGR